MEQKELKAYINKLIPPQMKVVLKRADKLKIPMELPEARELAIEDIIVAERLATEKQVCQLL